MSAKTDFVNGILAGLPATYAHALPVRAAIKTLAEAICDANGSLTPADLSVTNAKLANVATKTFKGRTTAGTGEPEDLTIAQARAALATSRVVSKNDDYTVLAADSGKIFVQTVDAKTFSLPAGADGLEYTFVNGGAAGAVLLAIDPNGTEIIFGTTNASTNVVLSGGAGKKLLNTKATACQGDSVTLTWVAGIGWLANNFSGIWASES